MESKPSPGNLSEAQKEAPKVSEITESGIEEKIALDTGVFDIILESIAKGIGTKVSDFTDDTGLAELGGFLIQLLVQTDMLTWRRWVGVDSIMGIEMAARASNETGLNILPSFVIDHPTISDLRNAFTRPTTSTPHSEPISEFSLVASTPEFTKDQVSALETEEIVVV